MEETTGSNDAGSRRMSDSPGLSIGTPAREGAINRLVGMVARQLGLHGLSTSKQFRSRLRVQRVELPLPGLDEDLDHVTIAHMSDLHLGLIMRESHIADCVEVVNRAKPDFVVITGDFLTTHARRYARRIAAMLGKLRPSMATLACLGNHDYGLWHPVAGWESRDLAEYLAAQLSSVGIIPLINESRTFTRGFGAIRFAGVGDCWSTSYRPDVAMCNDDAPCGAKAPAPTIGLVHNPDGAHDMAYLGASIVLAGHTHGKTAATSPVSRAIFPKAFRDFAGGYYKLPGGKHLYVNRGIGNSRRTCASTQSEITLISLRCPSRIRHWEPVIKSVALSDAPALLNA